MEDIITPQSPLNLSQEAATPAEEVQAEATPAVNNETPAAAPEPAPEAMPAPESAEATAAPAEQAPAEAESAPAEEAEALAEEKELPAEEAEALPSTKEAILARLREIVKDQEEIDREQMDRLKLLFYKLHNAEVTAVHEAYLAAGGDPEAFRPQPDEGEAEFKAQMARIREIRANAAAAREKEKSDNLARKLAIIEQIKQYATSPEEADKHFDAFKDLQAAWRDIKSVPAERATELWKNYQLYVEQYYDQLHLNHEFRALDFKKNLEAKEHLCEAAERLSEVDDPVSAFHQLQNLHQEYREIGPVSRELREAVWNRFKEASTLVNKRHQAHFEQLKAEEEGNLAKKTALCEQAEEMVATLPTTAGEWEKATERVIALQAEWKTVGFTPRKINAMIFDRFRTACDAFFSAKTTHFKSVREAFAKNLAAKVALCEQAEALKESTEWSATTNKLIALQKEWKATGPVARKQSEAIWHRFNEACNAFFAAKQAASAPEREAEEANLKAKLDIIAKLEALAATPGDNDREAVRTLQAAYQEIGHVPFRKKEKLFKRYRTACDTIYDRLHQEAGRRGVERYRSSLAARSQGGEAGAPAGSEVQRLMRAYEAKSAEIKNYETNLTFFSSKSKTGNALVLDLEKKVERLRQDLALIAEKIKVAREAAE